MPPHIAQLVAGHADINVTMGYKATYPEEVINAYRAFIARRRATRPGDEYRLPGDAEWNEFLGPSAARSPSATAAGPGGPAALMSTGRQVPPPPGGPGPASPPGTDLR
jgi:hypothetical protein